MALRLNRRTFMAGTAAAATGAAGFPMPSIAQNAPMKVGVLTVKTGPLAAGGIHCEEGITTFLKERGWTGRHDRSDASSLFVDHQRCQRRHFTPAQKFVGHIARHDNR